MNSNTTVSTAKMFNKSGFFYNMFVKQFDNMIEDNYTKDIAAATATKNASALDLALRAKMHMMNRGKSVDTSKMKFAEVEAIDANFYVGVE
jgi:hypothetical protein